ncbi:MAG TPA: molybdopterin cofactor-binding domain-containing protein [Balneolales bacterium]|nr:molybdopterin cofactor-binding domain-containing protein [Balneolales bacterium]
MSNKLLDQPLSRRAFLKWSGATGAALVLGYFSPAGSKTAVLKNLSDEFAFTSDLTPFIIIDSSNNITLMLHKPEMGQGTYQSMPMLLAEELEVTLEQVFIKPALANRKKYGPMYVYGSQSVRTSWKKLRSAGASAREMLISAASQTWNVPAKECYASEGKIHHKITGKTANYGDLIETAAKLDVPQNPKLKDSKNFNLIGKSLPRPDIPMKVDGTAEFGIDIKVPGMMYASVEHCPVFLGKVKSFDDSAAKAVPGVKYVLASERQMSRRTLYGVAVVADSYYAAYEGRKALKVEWDYGQYRNANTGDLFTQYRDLTGTKGEIVKDEGDFDAAYEKAAKKREGLYEMPFASHAPLEPQNAVAHVKGNKCEIWAPTQQPANTQEAIAQYLGIPVENVILHFTFMGGAFGRRNIKDPVFEAVFLSQKLGVPVKTVWTREDDMQQGPFRQAMVSRLRGGVDNSGNLVAFQHKIVSPSISYSQFGGPGAPKKPDHGAMDGIADSPYEIPNIRLHNIFADAPVGISWWRAVYSSTNCFPQECFIDEMAHAAGKDPLQFRIDLIRKNARMKNLYEFLREKSGWDESLPDGWGKGVAAIEYAAGRAGHVVYVSKKGIGVNIKRIVSVMDCGIVLNPDNVKAQVEGSVIMALTAALKDGITIRNGQVVQSNFDTYRMMRINEIPPIEVHIVPSSVDPNGAGEPALSPLAPALGNAIFAATGKRIRKLPFNINRI